MSQGPLNQKIRFLAQKMCSVARTQTDKKVKTEDTLSGLRIFFLQHTIKERSNSSTSLLMRTPYVHFSNYLGNIVSVAHLSLFILKITHCSYWKPPTLLLNKAQNHKTSIEEKSGFLSLYSVSVCVCVAMYVCMYVCPRAAGHTV